MTQLKRNVWFSLINGTNGLNGHQQFSAQLWMRNKLIVVVVVFTVIVAVVVVVVGLIVAVVAVGAVIVTVVVVVVVIVAVVVVAEVVVVMLVVSRLGRVGGGVRIVEGGCGGCRHGVGGGGSE